MLGRIPQVEVSKRKFKQVTISIPTRGDRRHGLKEPDRRSEGENAK